MEERDKNELMEKVNSFNAPIDTAKNIAESVIDAQKQSPMTVKQAIDLETTRTALKQEGTVEKLVTEKTEELKNDAEAKRISAEAKRIEEETTRAIKEQEKIIAEYNKEIEAKKKEVEQLKAESDKAKAYFEANKEILKYIGVRNAKSLNVMKTLMFPASLLFAIVQILLLPLTFTGVTVESVVNIVGGICGSIKNNAIKIICSVGIILLIGAIVFICYWLIGHYVVK